MTTNCNATLLFVFIPTGGLSEALLSRYQAWMTMEIKTK
jgi:hypothetical protein